MAVEDLDVADKRLGDVAGAAGCGLAVRSMRKSETVEFSLSTAGRADEEDILQAIQIDCAVDGEVGAGAGANAPSNSMSTVTVPFCIPESTG